MEELPAPGTYDAATQTLNVFLNGQLDNRTLVGTVDSSQQNSIQNVNLGNSPGASRFFAGVIDEARVYTRLSRVQKLQRT